MGIEHCEQISTTKRLKLIDASSRSEQRTKLIKEKFGILVFLSHNELIKKQWAQWIVIPTFTQEHKKWVLGAISNGKNLIIEKPININFKDAKEIFKKAEKRLPSYNTSESKMG